MDMYNMYNDLRLQVAALVDFNGGFSYLYVEKINLKSSSAEEEIKSL